MTHAERIEKAISEVATTLPGFESFPQPTQQILLELGEEYFREEFVPRLEGMINLPRYERAMFETTAEDREYIEDQSEYLTLCIEKAQRAAHDQLLEKSAGLMK